MKGGEAGWPEVFPRPEEDLCRRIKADNRRHLRQTNHRLAAKQTNMKVLVSTQLFILNNNSFFEVFF